MRGLGQAPRNCHQNRPFTHPYAALAKPLVILAAAGIQSPFCPLSTLQCPAHRPGARSTGSSASPYLSLPHCHKCVDARKGSGFPLRPECPNADPTRHNKTGKPADLCPHSSRRVGTRCYGPEELSAVLRAKHGEALVGVEDVGLQVVEDLCLVPFHGPRHADPIPEFLLTGIVHLVVG